MKKLVSFLLCIIMVLALVSCGTPTPSGTAAPSKPAVVQSAAPTAGKTYLVGFSVKDQTNPLFVDMVTAAKATFDAYNKKVGYEKIKLNVQACTGETKVEEQLTMVETFLTQNVNAIICTPLNSDAFVDFVKKCNDKGVAFINLDTMVNTAKLKEKGGMYDVFVGSDNVWLGANVAKAMVEDFPNGCKYIVLGGNPGAATHIGMDKGYQSVKATMGAGFTELKYELCNWQLPLAMETTTNLLPAYPDVQAIICFNDQMAQGAISAIEGFGKVPGKDIKVYGSNFVGNAPKYIDEGKQAFSVSRRPYYSGMIAAECAINFIDGVKPIHKLINEATRLIEFEGKIFRKGTFTLKDGKAYDMSGNLLLN